MIVELCCILSPLYVCVKMFSLTITVSQTTVVFMLQSGLVAVGTHKGLVQIWDAAAQKRVSTIEGHTARVGKQVNFVA